MCDDLDSPPDRPTSNGMRTLEEVHNWRGKTMVDADGHKIGSIEEIYVDRQTGEPEWAAV
jgi:hypothetical protein